MSMTFNPLSGEFDAIQKKVGKLKGITAGSILYVGSDLKIAEDNPAFTWDDVNKRLGIGTNSPEKSLHIATTGTAASVRVEADGSLVSFVGDTWSNSGSQGTFFIGRRARGTKDTPLKVTASDTVFTFDGQVWDGNAYVRGGQILGKVVDTPADSQGWATYRWEFRTTDSSGTLASRLTVAETGNVGIGTLDPSAMMDIVLNAADVTGLEINGITSQTSDYVDIQDFSTNPIFNIDSGGLVGVATSSQVYNFQVVSDDGDDAPSGTRGIVSTQHNNDIHGAAIGFRKSRGTEASPLAVNTNDFAGFFDNQAYAGSTAGYASTAAFGFVIDGTVVDGGSGIYDVPTAMVVYTGGGTGGSANPRAERMRISSDGNVMIGTNTARSTLTIKASPDNGFEAPVGNFFGGIELLMDDGYLSSTSTIYSDVQWHSNFMTWQRAKGTLASPASVIDGNLIGSFTAQAYEAGTTNAFLPIARLAFNVVGTPSGSDGFIKGKIGLATTDSNGDFFERLTVLPNGQTVLSTQFPTTADAKLDIINDLDQNCLKITAPSTFNNNYIEVIDFSTNPIFNIDSAGNVGIGTSPEYDFHLKRNTGADDGFIASIIENEDGYAVHILESHSDDVGLGSFFMARRSRGTKTSPLVPLTGDTVFTFDARPWDGDSWGRGGNIVGKIDGVVTDGITPMRWTFGTTNTSGVIAERFVIKNDGTIYIPFDNQKIMWGGGQDASIYYDGTNMWANPAEVGVGDLRIGDGGSNFTALEDDGSIRMEGTSRINWQKITANSITMTGATTGGTVSDLQSSNDGNVLTITEAGANPGQNIIIDFINVTAFNWVRALEGYDGSSTHALQKQLYNWITTSWDSFGSNQDIFTNGGTIFDNSDFLVPNSDDYIGTGADAGRVRFRAIHPISGNVSDRWYFDEVSLQQ